MTNYRYIINPHTGRLQKVLKDDYIKAIDDIADVISKEHEHSNKTELDKVTDGDHDIRIDNPHDTDIGEGHINILPLSYDSIGQGAWSWYKESNYILNGLFVNGSNADGDNINYKIYLDKGTYTLLYISNTNNNYGIAGIYIDEAHIVNFDCYSTALAITVSNKQTDIVITTSGIKTLKVKINGKNQASSDYFAAIEYIALWRTS